MEFLTNIINLVVLNIRIGLDSIMGILFSNTEIFAVIKKMLAYIPPMGIVILLLGVPTIFLTIIKLLSNDIIKLYN